MLDQRRDSIIRAPGGTLRPSFSPHSSEQQVHSGCASTRVLPSGACCFPFSPNVYVL